MKEVIMFGSLIVLVIVLVSGACFGYIANIVRLADTDFQAPYKAEIIRVVGIAVPPLGMVAGFINIAD